MANTDPSTNGGIWYNPIREYKPPLRAPTGQRRVMLKEELSEAARWLRGEIVMLRVDDIDVYVQEPASDKEYPWYWAEVAYDHALETSCMGPTPEVALTHARDWVLVQIDAEHERQREEEEYKR